MTEEIRFEEALKRLEEISDLLDHGEIGLEQSIQLFEEGLKLSQYCNQKLNVFETRINELVRIYEKGDSDEGTI